MKSKTVNSIVLSSVILYAGSCDRPGCTNTNPVFAKSAPDTKEYKDELSKQIQITGPEKLTYWFDNYHNSNGKDFVGVLVQGEGLCAKADMLVREWGKLAGIKDTEGKGYRGAELKGLKIALEEGSTGTEFIYKDLDRIVD